MNKENSDKRRKLESSSHNKVIGWGMTPDETLAFFYGLGKKVVTFFGYSSAYEDKKAMLEIVETVLSEYSPEKYIINIGATIGGIGAAYPVAKSLGFTTTGIVSSLAIEYIDYISKDVDHICFLKDDQWGGKISDTDELSPTSQAMVACSDILIGVGGGEICRDEMIAGREQGKPVHFYPAEINHEYLIHRAKKMDLPSPESFWGAVHEVFVDNHEL